MSVVVCPQALIAHFRLSEFHLFTFWELFWILYLGLALSYIIQLLLPFWTSDLNQPIQKYTVQTSDPDCALPVHKSLYSSAPCDTWHCICDPCGVGLRKGVLDSGDKHTTRARDHSSMLRMALEEPHSFCALTIYSDGVARIWRGLWCDPVHATVGRRGDKYVVKGAEKDRPSAESTDSRQSASLALQHYKSVNYVGM